MGRPETCPGLGNSNLNRLVSCVRISLAINLKGCFALESTSAILCTRLLSEFMESVEFFNNFHINIAPTTAAPVPISREYFIRLRCA